MAATSLTFMKEGDFVNVVKLKDGGYGSIFKGTHRELGYQAAIKSMKTADGVTDDRSRDDLMKEVGILQQIRHPYILYVYGFINHPKCFAMVMELAEYGSLKDFLQLLLPVQPPVSVIVRMMHQITLAMVYLHGRSPSILHLDLKAANVLVTGELVAKIADFGLSELRQYQEQHTTTLMHSRDAPMRGTLTHVPPEKLKDIYIVPGKKYDVYGFSILLWELASSKRAFDGVQTDLLYTVVPQGQRPPVTALHRDLPPMVLQLMQDCWHSDPLQRPDFTDIRKITEEVLCRYDDRIKNDEIALKNLIYQRQVKRQTVSSGCSTPVQESRPEKAQESPSMQPKYLEAMQNPSSADPTVNGAKQKNDGTSHRAVGPQISVERSTATQSLNTDISALKLDSRAGSVSTLSTNGDSLPSPQRSLQLDGESTCSAEGSRAYPTVVGKGRFDGTAPNLSLSVCRDSDVSQKGLTETKGKAGVGSDLSDLDLNTGLDTDAAPPPNPQGDRGSARVSTTQTTGQLTSNQSTAIRHSASSGSRIGRSSSSSGATRDGPSEPLLKGPQSQTHRSQSAQGASLRGSYPQYVPHLGGFLYYPCPDVRPVFIPAIDGKIPDGMPAPGSLMSGSTTVIQGPNTVISNKHGTTRVVSSSGISNMQVGNKNIMYIGAMPGARSKGSAQAPQPFDMSKITKSKRKMTAEDMELIADNIGHSWKQLARKLDFSDGQIDGFEHDNKSLFEMSYQMLARYCQRLGDDATVDNVVAALCAVRKPDVAALLPRDASESQGSGGPADAASVAGKSRHSGSGSMANITPAVNNDPVLFSLGAPATAAPARQRDAPATTGILGRAEAASTNAQPFARAASANNVYSSPAFRAH